MDMIKQDGSAADGSKQGGESNVRSNKCAYHRDAQWRLPGDMPDMASDNRLANYSRCTDLEFHTVYGQENEIRKRGLNLK